MFLILQILGLLFCHLIPNSQNVSMTQVHSSINAVMEIGTCYAGNIINIHSELALGINIEYGDICIGTSKYVYMMN
jgi:hypothetical protein